VGREIQGLLPCVTTRLDPPVKMFDGSEAPLCAGAGGSGGPAEEVEQGSIIIVVGTDAPLSPDQLKRVVRRVALGMGRMGSVNGNGSGDIFIAFSTANRGVDWGNSGGPIKFPPPTMVRLPAGAMDPMFTATVEATEEAIINAMLAAETMTGADYWRSYALPADRVREILKAHGRLN
jgi:L-aminopeptidase/D-esterase-like protein